MRGLRIAFWGLLMFVFGVYLMALGKSLEHRGGAPEVAKQAETPPVSPDPYEISLGIPK